jgi:hypothetical protein
MSEMLVPVSPGEVMDKITILRIKAARITDAAKLANVKRELEILETHMGGIRLWAAGHFGRHGGPSSCQRAPVGNRRRYSR